MPSRALCSNGAQFPSFAIYTANFVDMHSDSCVQLAPESALASGTRMLGAARLHVASVGRIRICVMVVGRYHIVGKDLVNPKHCVQSLMLARNEPGQQDGSKP